MSYECTIVTAYYDLPFKKHSSSNYSIWMGYFFNTIKSNIIVFTDTKSSKMLFDLCKDMKNVKTIIFPLEKFFTFKYIDYWKKDYERDTEKYHNPYLYMIWNEKSMFIRHAIHINPFNTEYYAWTDIGMIRDPEQIKYVNMYPNPNIIKTLKNDKVYILNIADFTEQELRETDVTQIFKYKNRIGGGVIFGHKDVLMEWYKIYYDMMSAFMKNDYYAGKDQSIMACVYLKYREKLIELVKPTYSPINKWFYMLYYLGNAT